MICVLVKDKDGNIVGKEVFFGDDAKNNEAIAKRQAENMSSTYEVVDEATHLAASCINPAQIEWQKVKALGVDAAISHLAAKLGLE